MVAKPKKRRQPGTERWRPKWNAKLLAFDMVSQGLTQTALAARARVTQVTVSRILRGEPGQVGIRQVRRVAEALGQPIERYLADVVWEPPPELVESAR